MSTRPEREYRNYDPSGHSSVAELYRENHALQTLAFVLEQKRRYLPLRRERLGVWEAIERLDAIVDTSDPDLELSQLAHALQTAEALRADGHPRWLVLTGFVHDLGKLLCLFGEPQWAVVGDTFAVGCAFPDEVVHAGFFAANPDTRDPAFASQLGIYESGCGLDRVHFSWGHDEYLYQVLQPWLPAEALAIIRYHSCYVWHSGGAYRELMNADDEAALGHVQLFNRYDLYSKSDRAPDWNALRGYYQELVEEFLPHELQW